MSGNRVSNNFNNNQFYQQQQYQQSLQQQQAEIRYYVYQDIQNLINLIYARNAVLEHFKNDPTHPMITLSNNKILLQLNMSCAIHKDLDKQYYQDRYLLEQLKLERNKAFNILKKVIDFNSAIYLNNIKQTNSLENELQRYKQFYETQKFELNQFQIQETGLQAKFDEQVLAKIISSVQSVDLKINQLRNGQSYDSPSENDILRTALNYQQDAEIKLSYYYQQHSANHGMSQSVLNQNSFQAHNQKVIGKETFIDIGSQNNNDKNLNNQLDNERDQLFYFLQDLESFKSPNTNIFKEKINRQHQEFLDKKQQNQNSQIVQALISKNYLKEHIQLYYYFYLFSQYKNLMKVNHQQQIHAENVFLQLEQETTKEKYPIYGFLQYLHDCKSNKLILHDTTNNLISEKQNCYLFYQIFCNLRVK